MQKTAQHILLSILIGVNLSACRSDTSDSDNTSAPTTETAFDAASVWATLRNDFDLFYAYRDDRGFDADAYLDRVGTLVSAAPDRATFRRQLHRAAYAFTDPHLGFGPAEDGDFNIIPTSSDLQIDHRAGQYYVADVRSDSAAYEAGIRPGWILNTADERPIQDLAAAVFTDLIDAPSDAQLDYAGTLVANGRRVGDRSLVFLTPEGETQRLDLANPREQARAVMARPAIETQRIATPDGSMIAVIRINNRLGDNDLITGFDAAMAEVMEADGLILDLRNTPSGGNSEVGRSIMGHFTDRVRPFQIHTIPSLEREFTVPRRFVEQVTPRSPNFDPFRTVVLGGHWTGSMGEGIVIGMDALGVHSIASDMGDLLGAMSNFSFADQTITLSIPTEALFHVDGTPREDFVADQSLTSADSDENAGDPALEAALIYLRDQ